MIRENCVEFMFVEICCVVGELLIIWMIEMFLGMDEVLIRCVFI